MKTLYFMTKIKVTTRKYGNLLVAFKIKMVNTLKTSIHYLLSIIYQCKMRSY